MKQLARNGDGDFDGPVLETLRLLWELDHSLQLASKRMSRTLDMTGPQRFVLRALARHSDVTPGELAELLHLDKSTLTGVLNRLLKKRLIHRATDSADGRRARIRLTNRGLSFAAIRHGTIEEALERTVASLDGSSLAGAYAFLNALIRDLARIGAESP